MPNFSAKWGLMEQLQAVAAGTWTGLPTSELYAWGANSSGTLGLNDRNGRSSPSQVGTLTNWDASSSGQGFIGALKSDGTLWMSGSNNNGQLGDNSVINRSSPVQVGLLSDWSVIACGSGFTVAVKNNNTLWAWGYGDAGRLANNSYSNRSSPIQVGALTNWANAKTSLVSVGHAAAVKTDGTLWTWGSNAVGQLGVGNTISRSSPVQVGALTDWSIIAVGVGNVGSIKADGTLWTWGENANGQLGNGLSGIGNRASSPVKIGALTDWSKLSAGSYCFMAVKTDGTLWAWGNNTQGELGQNNVIARSSPVQIGALTTWSSVSGPSAIKNDGTLWAWGSNASGQVGDGTVVRRSSPVQIGSSTAWLSTSKNDGSGVSTAIFQGKTN